MDISKLIGLIPDLVELFFPGFVFFATYDYLRKLKREYSITILLSFLMSYFINCLCDAFYCPAIMTARDRLLRIMFSFILGAFVAWFQNTKLFEFLLTKMFHRTVNDDILDDLVDLKKPMYVNLRMKSGEEILGRFSLRDNSRDGMYVALVNYSINGENTDLNSSIILISLSDADKVEFIYDVNSETWQRLRIK